jgi:hypothetical protein
MSSIFNGDHEITVSNQASGGFYALQPGRIERLLQVLDQWHAAHKVDYLKSYAESYNSVLDWGARFDLGEEKHARIGHKYARLDTGTSGAWMLECATGDIWQIKGYGKVDKKKCAGNINDPEFDGAVLFRDRFRYGRFDNRKKVVS